MTVLTPPLLDTARALSFLGGDGEVLIELLQTFLNDAVGELEGYKAALAQPDPAAILRYLHRLVPTLAIVAKPALHEEARVLYQVLQGPGEPLDAHLPRALALARAMDGLLAETSVQLSR